MGRPARRSKVVAGCPDAWSRIPRKSTTGRTIQRKRALGRLDRLEQLAGDLVVCFEEGGLEIDDIGRSAPTPRTNGPQGL